MNIGVIATACLNKLLDICKIPRSCAERADGSKLSPATDGLGLQWTILRSAHRDNPIKTFGLLDVPLGLALVAAAVVLNQESLGTCLATGQVFLPRPCVVTSASRFLLGLTMALRGPLVRPLRWVAQRRQELPP